MSDPQTSALKIGQTQKVISRRKIKRKIMEDKEKLRRNTEKAYQEALRAMFDLVNAITEERNYYRDLCLVKDTYNK